MKTNERLRGLIAALYTPFNEAGELNLNQCETIVERLLAEGVSGFYICGSTGEGMSLTTAERRDTTEAYVQAVASRVPTIIQVGHNSLREARALAEHAQHIGATVISATCPSYFKPNGLEVLVKSMAEVAQGAPDLPFYYYHIPSLTGVACDMVAFLQRAGDRIPNLAGLKYTMQTVHEFQLCRALDDERFDVLWGCDEMLLSALAVGAEGAVGSTYNIAAPLYLRIIDAFERGDLDAARRDQARSAELIRTIAQWPFHPAMKEILKTLDLDCGPCRLPHPRLSSGETAELHKQLKSIGFYDWRVS